LTSAGVAFLAVCLWFSVAFYSQYYPYVILDGKTAPNLDFTKNNDHSMILNPFGDDQLLSEHIQSAIFNPRCTYYSAHETKLNQFVEFREGVVYTFTITVLNVYAVPFGNANGAECHKLITWKYRNPKVPLHIIYSCWRLLLTQPRRFKNAIPRAALRKVRQ
jgi:hypothetical protein